jgi:argininosuccinate lyase
MALWGGRFAQGPEDSAFALSRSVHFDWRLAPYDLRSSMAHLAILKKNGLVTPKDADAISKALKELTQEVAAGVFVAIDSDEDVHSALERGLSEKLGSVGGSLRAGRSRNDQVTTDLRLFSIDYMLEIATLVTQLQTAILEKASEYVNDPAPGFTHIQHAQPVSFGHELAKHAHAFARDLDRVNDWLARSSVSSLGAVARVLDELASGDRTLPALPTEQEMARMMNVCVGEHVPREYAVMAMQEMGFRDRRVEWREPPPAGRLPSREQRVQSWV